MPLAESIAAIAACALLHEPPPIASLKVVDEPTHTLVAPVGNGTQVIERIRLLPISAIYTLPLLSTATPSGTGISAEVGGPPSPPYPPIPLPAIVVIIPAALTFLIRLLPQSAIYTLPLPSTATPYGL